MAVCQVPGCGGFSLSGDICAMCATKAPHQVLNAVQAGAADAGGGGGGPAIVLMPAEGTTTPHDKFAEACADYEDRFTAILTSTQHGTKESVKNCMVYHNTQKAANRTVFYDFQGRNLRIFGVGEHSGGDGAGNDSYSMVWYNGKNSSFTRSKKKKR